MVFMPGMSSEGSLTERSDAINQIKATVSYDIKFIHKELIVPNKMNVRYSQEDLEALRDSILDCGLLHNLVVILNDDKKTYRLISGERRWHAISLMEEEDYDRLFPAGIPCKIQSGNMNAIDEEISLISANSEVRNRSVQDNLNDIARLLELYKMKAEQGLGGDVVGEISTRLGISERQVRKYINVEKLIPELMEALNQKQISFEDANRYALLGENEQLILFGFLQDNGEITDEDYETVKDYKHQEEELRKKDEKIAQLEQMLQEASGVKANVVGKMLEEAKEEKKKAQSIYPNGLSRKELDRIRKHNKATKAVTTLEDTITKMEKLIPTIQEDPELSVRMVMIQQMLNTLLE